MVPLPPARFSTTTGCFHASPIFCPMVRATMSVPPPGANGTIRRMGRDGKSAAGSACANTRGHAARLASPTPACSNSRRPGFIGLRIYNHRRLQTAARSLARFASALQLADVPALDVERATQCLIDLVGVALLGSSFPWAQSARRYAEHYGAGGTSRVLGGSAARISAPLAALANGVAAHAFELDSLRRPGAGVHPGAALVPGARPPRDGPHSSRADLLAALAAGCAVMFRIGAASLHSSESLGFHAPGHTGPSGAAVVAGGLTRP